MDRREKFRLRYYGEEPAFFKLEKKYKVKGLCGKRGAQALPGGGGAAACGEDFAFLLETEEPLAPGVLQQAAREGLAPQDRGAL